MNSNYYTAQPLDTICLMGIYDMNGKSGPNKVGMDIGFVGSFYNGYQTRSVAVLPHQEEKIYSASGLTGSTTFEKLYNYCDKLGNNHDWIMPDMYEMSVIYLTKKLTTNSNSYITRGYFTRTLVGYNDYVRFACFYSDCGGHIDWQPKKYNSVSYVRCVRNTALK